MVSQLDLSALLQILPCSVYWKSAEGIYLGCNDYTARFAGLNSASEIIGKTDYDMPWRDQADAIFKMDQEVLSDGKQELTTQETKRTAQDGSLTFLTIRLALEGVGILCVAMDVTQLKNQLTEASKAQQEFSSKLSEEVIGKTAASSYQTVEQQARAVRYHLESIIACMPGNVYWADKNSVYLGCNDNVARMLGLRSRTEIAGKTYEEVSKLLGWTEGQGESFRKDDMEVVQVGKPKLNVEEPPITDARGNILYFLTSRVPLFDENKNVIGVVGISIDITERKKMEEALREAKIAAEAADKAKTEFLENMRHDIRTPLSGIIGCANLIKDSLNKGEKAEEIKEYADNLVASSHALLHFLNEILEVIKVASGGVPLFKKKFNLKEKLLDVIKLNQSKADHKHLKLLLDYDNAIPRYLIGDSIRIHRIILELVTNALNFTVKGYIKISAKLAKKNQREIIVKIIVEDTGAGIAPDKQQEIFTRFKRLTPSYEGIYKGAGLGLSVVKQFIDDLEGEIYLESELQKGSVFSCVMPLQEALLDESLGVDQVSHELIKSELSIPKISIVHIPEQTNELTRVLVVEDLDIAAKVARSILTGLNCVVDVADNGRSAVRMAKTNQYDLIFMDVGLPDINGNEVTKKIRGWETSVNAEYTPVIALTAHIDIDSKEQCIKAGMDAVISKPLVKETVLSILNAFVPKWRDLSEPVAALSHQDEEKFLFELSGAIIDLDVAIKTCENEEVAKELITMLINSLPKEQLNLQEAYEQQNWSYIREAAHKLRGGAAYCGAQRLRIACAHLEDYLKMEKTELRDKLYHQLLQEITNILQISITSSAHIF